MRNVVGKSGSAGDACQCIQAVSKVFSALDGYHKKCIFILVDEIYVKPLISYRGGHLIGLSQNHVIPKTPKQSLLLWSVLLKVRLHL